MRLSRLLGRIAVAAGLTAYLLWHSQPGAVGAALAHADWRPILLAISLVLIDRALMAYRWIELLCIVDPGDRPPLTEIIRIFFVSTFVGTFLPASVGGDAVRAYSIARLRVGTGDAVASVLMDRMIGVASILVMALVGLVLARDLAENRTIVAALAVAGGVCVGTLLLVFSRRTAVLAAAFSSQLPARFRQMADALVASIRRYAAFHRQLALVLACSILVQAVRVLQAYYLGLGLRIDAPLSTYFAFVPLILLVMLLPVTFNGIGTSQAAFVWFFARAGVPAAEAFALSVLFVALGVVGNLPGGILFAAGRGSGRGAPSTAPTRR